MRCPNSFSNCSNAWGLKGALPDTYSLRGFGRSERPSASRSSRVYIVGTPKNIVKPPARMAS
jgi:hypothetical protein